MKSLDYTCRRFGEVLALASLAACMAPALPAQTAPTTTDAVNPSQNVSPDDQDKTIQLTPFEVTTNKDVGYAATSSLAGSRLNTSLRDVGSAISVVTPEFLKDTGATDIQHVLIYQLDTEVAGIDGNFYGSNADDGTYRRKVLTNPQSATRVRGLDNADLTREFFTTSIGLDAYNTSRIDIQRGPNSILFGLGSPAGIINDTLKAPNMNKNTTDIEVRFGSYGSQRETVDQDVTLIPNTLGIRVTGLNDDAKFRQDFTYDHDKRIFGALRFQPKLGQGVYTQIDVSAESGHDRSNRPVAVTPADFITNWFGPLNKYLMYDPLTSNGIPQDPNHIQHTDLTAYFAGAPGRDWWNGSPGTIYSNPASGAIGAGGLDAYRQRDGEPWGGLSGVTNANWTEGGPWIKDQASYYANNPVTSKIISDYEKATGNTFSGFGSSLWPTQMILTGPLAFTNQTIQGPNKSEWNGFETINLSASQTYLNGRLGINAAYYHENYRSGYANTIDSDRVTVDVNAFLRDGSANPNVGRVVVYAPSSGNMISQKREAHRETAFYKLKPSDVVGHDSFLDTIFGEQTFTGVLADQKYSSFERDFELYAYDPKTFSEAFIPGDTSYWNWWGIHYLGDSQLNTANFNAISASSIHPITAIQTPTSPSANTLVWDENTKTWHNASVNIVNWNDDLSHLYTNASEGKDDTRSKSFVWQGRLLNDAIIPLFGWRRDIYTHWDKPSSLPKDANQTVEPYSPDWSYNGTTPLDADEQRRSWGLVVHTAQILDLFHHYKLPEGLDVSFTYNDSNSFRPSDVGTDVYGQKLAAPSGRTRDMGFLVSVLDNKYSLRMTWYNTLQKNTSLADPSGIVYWNKAGIARTMNAMEMETWTSGTYRQQTTPEWLVNKWLFGTNYDKTVAAEPLPTDWRNQISTLLNEPLRIRRAAVQGNSEYIAQGTINPATSTPYLAPPLDDDELAYRKLWFAARTDDQWSRPIDPAWWSAMQFKQDGGTDWGIWGQNSPAGEKLTNDLSSKGMELEFTANPTTSWRLTLNLSRTTAARSNIMADWPAFVANMKDLWFDGYNDTPINQLNYWNIDGFADIRHWYGETTYSGAADTFGGRMMQNVYGPYENLLAENGQAVNELRKWHVNFVNNYSFNHGFLRGFNVGGAVRWQSKAAIGYNPKFNSDAQIWVNDVSSPIYAGSETNYDAWIGYAHKIRKGITWEIQLNVYNLFANDSLVPILANPDGTTAQVRIPAETTWTLTNRFSF